MFGLAWLAVGWVRVGQVCIFVRRWCSLAGDAEVASSRGRGSPLGVRRFGDLVASHRAVVGAGSSSEVQERAR
jgi:hypothetical protein